MYEQGRISPLQLGLLVFVTLSGFSTLFSLEIKLVGTDTWISQLIGMLGCLALVLLLLHIQRLYPELNFFEYTEVLVGKWVSKLFFAIYLYYAAELCVLCAKALVSFYVTAINPQTPSSVFSLLIFVTTSYAIFLRLEVIARAMQVMVPLFLVFLIVINVLIVHEVMTNPFLPMFQSNFNSMVHASIISLSAPFGKIVLFGALFSYVKKRSKLWVSSATAIVCSGIYLFIATYLTVGSIGLYYSKTSAFPFFTSIRLARIGEYIERFEISVIGFWTIFTIFEIIVAQYVLTMGIGYLGGLQKVNPLIVPLGLLLFGLTEKSFPYGPSSIVDFDQNIFPFLSVIPVVVIPCVLFAAAVIKSRLNTAHPHK